MTNCELTVRASRARSEDAGAPEHPYQRAIRLIFCSFRVKLYIRPLPSKMKPTIGLASLFVSTEPPTPTVTMATDPSTPAFQPSTRRKPSSASGVMNTMMTDRA